jgi:hypothetical protein
LDCCFHPETIDMSLKVPGFKDLVVETARETCVRGFKNVKDDVEIDKKYHVLKGVTYKKGDVVTMIISKQKSKDQWEEKKEQPKVEDKVRCPSLVLLWADTQTQLSQLTPLPATTTPAEETRRTQGACAKEGLHDGQEDHEEGRREGGR